MDSLVGRLIEFWRELRRRHVVKVAGAYVLVALTIAQISDRLFSALLFPEWTVRLVPILAALGFPVVLIMAWALEITPDGVRRTEELDRERRPAGAGAGREADEPTAGRGGSGFSGRAVGVGIAAGLVTVVALGVWTAGRESGEASGEDPPAATAEAGDTAAAGTAADEPARADSAGAPETAAAARETADPGREGPAPTREDTAATGRSPLEEPEEATRRRATGEDPAAEPPPPERTGEEAAVQLSGALVLVRGSGTPGQRTVEDVLLSELADAGLDVMDQTALEIRRSAAGGSAEGAEALGRRAGAEVVVVGEFRSSAERSVGGFYTGSASLSVRGYDTATGELLLSETFEVGGGGTPGEMAGNPEGAARQAAEKVAHRAASALIRELRDRLTGPR